MINKPLNFFKIIMLLGILLSFNYRNITNSPSPTEKTKGKTFSYSPWRTTSKPSRKVSVLPSSFKNWEEYVRAINRMICNDTLPLVSIKKENKTKNIIIANPSFCSGIACYSSKEVVIIHPDTILKPGHLHHYPLDSMPVVIKREWQKQKANPESTGKRQKLIFEIAYPPNYSDWYHFIKTLDMLTENFYTVTGQKNIIIILRDQITGEDY